MVELEENLPRIRKEGLGVAAISYDSVAILKNFSERRKITFPLLSDPDSQIIRAFGILNETLKPGNAAYGIPHPGTFIVDRQGRVVSKYFEKDYRERVSVSGILAGQFGRRADASGAAVQARHVRLSTAASTAVARPGHGILLTLDLEMKPRMHVYAPGVTGYIPIDWKLEDTAAARLRPVAYPAAQTLHLKPIRETALVYQGRVRIAREITFGAESALKPLLNSSGDLVVKGSLRYQACDDRECYAPETVPLEWKFRFEPLDLERVPAELRR